MTKITVVLPVRNGENYLESSIESVLKQTLRDFALHVLDDASIDSSGLIAQSANDPRVQYSRNAEPSGLFKTLNRGFAEADSPLVKIWAHDDLMLPNCLERCIDTAEKNPSCGMIYSDFFAIDSDGTRTGKEQLFRSQRERTPEIAGPELSAALFFCFGCLPGNISTVLLRRNVWKEVGGFIEGLQQSPDYDMWLRISERYDVGYIPEKLIELRDHALQLGKAGQKHLTTIREELPIFRKLRERLAPVLDDREAVRFWRQHRGRQHVHWIAKALLRGEIENAKKAWLELREFGQPFRQGAFWLLSGNGRYFTIEPEHFFDTCLLKKQRSP